VATVRAMRAFLVVVFVFGSAGAEAKSVTERPVEVPMVPGAGYDALDVNRLSLVATRSSLIVDGVSVAALTDGQIAAGDKDGLVIAPVKRVLEQRLALPRAKPELTLFLDKTTPYRSLVELVVTAREAGIQSFYLATQTPSGAVAAPLALSTTADATASGLVVSVLQDEVLVWSRAGDEGTLAQPKTTISLGRLTAMTELTVALTEIAARRWPERKPTIALQAEAAVSAQLIAHVIGAMRATLAGKDLFPDVVLSA
jgi:biopolymer transport protein ExbD